MSIILNKWYSLGYQILILSQLLNFLLESQPLFLEW